MENHHWNSEISHEKWWFSIANCKHLPEGISQHDVRIDPHSDWWIAVLPIKTLPCSYESMIIPMLSRWFFVGYISHVYIYTLCAYLCVYVYIYYVYVYIYIYISHISLFFPELSWKVLRSLKSQKSVVFATTSNWTLISLTSNSALRQLCSFRTKNLEIWRWVLDPWWLAFFPHQWMGKWWENIGKWWENDGTSPNSMEVW